MPARRYTSGRVERSKQGPFDPAGMTAGAINAALDRLDAERSAIVDQFIAAGRGTELPSERGRNPIPFRNATAMWRTRTGQSGGRSNAGTVPVRRGGCLAGLVLRAHPEQDMLLRMRAC